MRLTEKVECGFSWIKTEWAVVTMLMNTASSLKGVDFIKRLDNYVISRKLKLSCVRIISRLVRLCVSYADADLLLVCTCYVAVV